MSRCFKTCAKCLITGVAGNVGSKLAKKLLDAGHFVVGVDNFFSGNLQIVDALKAHPNFIFYK